MRLLARSPRHALAAPCLATVALVAGCNGEGSQRPPPDRSGPGFVGIVSEDLLAGDRDYRERTLARQRALGVRLIRQSFSWARIEIAPGRYDFSELDEYVESLARQRMELLPILFEPPRFRSSAPRQGARRGTYPPRRYEDLGRFAERLARRYGPDGSFWRQRRELPPRPIRAWQVWNEPNLPVYWPSGPDPAAYVRLLAAAARGIHRVDPRAEIVSAGVANSRLGVPVEQFVRGMYEAGAGRVVDTFGLNPFGSDVGGSVAAIESMRELLDELGARVPIWVTELAWASEGPASPFTVGERGQARRVGRALRELIARRRELGVRGVIYFNWRDAPPYPGGRDFFGLHAGLLRMDGSAKPALRAFGEAARRMGR